MSRLGARTAILRIGFKIMQAWRTHNCAARPALHCNRKKLNLIMSASGNAAGQVKLRNFRLQDAGLSAPEKQDGNLILYTHCLCPYAERAWLTLLEKVKMHHLYSRYHRFSSHLRLTHFPPNFSSPECCISSCSHRS
jgi:hypothetical protein